MFSTNVQNLDTIVTWDPRFLNSCFITFYNILDFIITDCWHPNKLSCWRITPYWLPVKAYSTYSQPPSFLGSHLPCLQHLGVPCHSNNRPI